MRSQNKPWYPWHVHQTSMYLQNLEMGKWAITEKPQGKISKSKKVPCRKVTLF